MPIKYINVVDCNSI